jgi:hypothetical protein
MSVWLRGSGASLSGAYKAGLLAFTSLANCQSNTISNTYTPINSSNPGITYITASGSIQPIATEIWGKAYLLNNSSDGTDIYFDGVLLNQSNFAAGLDLAETYPAAKKDNIQIGEIVALGDKEKQNGADVQNIKKSSSSYDNNAFGVTATQPGLVLDDNGTYNKIKVALKGRVPVLVTTENGPIKVGDPITASSKPGVGMKATRSGRIIGYAMSEWTSSNPQEVDQVTVFVNPETYIDLSILTSLQESVAKLPALTASALSRADDIIINSADAMLLTTQKLVAQSITAVNATIDNLIVDRLVARELTAKTVKTDTLVAQKINSDSIDTQDLTAKDATFSGKLIAQEIDADNIRELRDKLEKISADQSSIPTIDSAELQSEVEKIQQYLADLPKQENTQLPIHPISTDQAITSESITSISGDQINMTNLENLSVTGQSAMTTLTVADSFSAGNVFIKDNSLLSLSNELKLSALEQVNIMDGAVIIAKNGTITAKGEVIAEKGVRTNTIKPLDGQSTVGLQLAENKLQVINNDTVVAAVDNLGSARFKDVSVDTYTEATNSAAIIAAEDNYQDNGIFSPAIQTNAAAAGNGILPAKNDTIIVYNDKIGPKSLVYITATSKTFNQNLYVAEKISCTDIQKANENCKPYFTVHIDGVVKDPITFNWSIVN